MNTPPPLPKPISPAKPDWRRALGGVWRLTYQRFLSPTQLGILAGLLAVLALLSLSGVHSGNAKHFGHWTVRFYLAFVVPVIAFITSAGLIQDDMKSSTVDYVLTRPVRRHAFVLYRYLAQTACLQIQSLLALSVLVVVGVVRQIPELSSTVPSLVLAQFLAIPAFSALGFAFGAYTSRFLVLGIFYAGVIEVGIGNIPTQLNRLSLTHHVRNIANSILNLRIHGLTENDGLPTSVISLLLASVVFVAVAALLFALRETAGTKPKDA